jgi:hypothetical protein
MTERGDPAPGEPRDDPSGPDFWLAPFFRESTLWPVLAAAAMIITALGTWALLLAFVERNPFGVAAVLVLLWISVDASLRNWRRGRARLLIGCLVGFWLLSSAAAVGVRWLGWF